MYVDQDGDGLRKAGEPGLPGVAVSNGRDVVLTNDAGAYILPLDEGRRVFVIKPPAFRLPATPDGRQVFSLVPRVPRANAGSFVGGHDFALLPGDAGERFSILVMADPQINDFFTAGLLERGIVQPLARATRYRFGLTLGDIVWDDLTLLPVAAAIFAKIGIPWFHTLGNHDVDMAAATPEAAEAAFQDQFGPTHYAFNEGRVHFLILNSILLQPGARKLHYRGGLTRRQLEFVERDLRHVAPDRLIVVALHHPLYRNPGEGVALSAEHRAQLFSLLSRFPHTLSISGHAHAQSRWRFGANDDWIGPRPHEHFNVGTVSGDWWAGRRNRAGLPDAMMRDGTPQGYASLHFAGADYRIEYTPAGASAPGQFHVQGPAEVSAAGPPAYVFVNYYLGSSETQVHFRLGAGEWQPFRQVWEADPLRERKHHEWPADAEQARAWGARPSPAIRSTHLWKAPLPRDGINGDRVLQIRILTVEGDELFARHAYRLTP